MPNVQGRNVENKIFINYAVCKFLSRIILKKLNVDSLTTFRKVEKILKKKFGIIADSYSTPSKTSRKHVSDYKNVSSFKVTRV